jgi:hypothetical protein
VQNLVPFSTERDQVGEPVGKPFKNSYSPRILTDPLMQIVSNPRLKLQLFLTTIIFEVASRQSRWVKIILSEETL